MQHRERPPESPSRAKHHSSGFIRSLGQRHQAHYCGFVAGSGTNLFFAFTSNAANGPKLTSSVCSPSFPRRMSIEQCHDPPPLLPATAARGVVVLCAWLAWERSVVGRRLAFRRNHTDGTQFVFTTEASWQSKMPGSPPAGAMIPPRKTVSWVRELLGDEAIQSIAIDPAVNEIDAATAGRLFPEARISRIRIWTPAPVQFDAPLRINMPAG